MSFVYFKRNEFTCTCGCGRNEIPDSFIHDLDDLRDMCRFPLVVTSGWRCENHPKERVKVKPGQHNIAAADVKFNDGEQLYTIMQCAFELGFTGIAAGKGFVHLDKREYATSWVY